MRRPLIQLPSTKVWHDKTVKIGDLVFSPAGSSDPACGRVSMILPGLFGKDLVLIESVDSAGNVSWWASDASRCEKGKQ